ncbi:T9SS type A sorting domain-containing protein [Runella slithyformis]|uniref:Secretion system C-terminal sorting domain-containing protein n=1 Tax=Runella slithyformis (strain ATCC 29530 / DSM 19594 / LMG 11500 / NCIMB 11436 / LSU 4) TaxID=761193 RepID=A0A7U4E6E4_RUNSL|nr:T9SS type A sorting domain-containing protein [Runella slithyformis]AEI49458.1 hypothetical protein Runsl_3074 [Runella slithyformis DSM 19594]
MKNICTVLIILLPYLGKAQQTLVETFGTVSATTTIAAHEAAGNFDLDDLTYSGTSSIRNTSSSSGYSGASGGANVFFPGNINATLTVQRFSPNLSCAGVNATTITVGLRKEDIGENGNNFTFQYSTDGGSTWSVSVGVSPLLPVGTGTTGWYLRSWNTPGNANAFRFQNTSSLSTFRIDDLVITNNNAGCSLPVRLISFKSEAQATGIELSWQTGEEIGNSHFDIERSTDAQHFESIGRVSGKGNSSVKQVYSFFDASPKNGPNYYRLKQIDFDGKFEYSRIVSAAFIGTGIFKVYPNPVSSMLRIELPGETEIGSAFLYDLTGCRVKEFSTAALKLEGIDNGIYFLQVQTKDGRIFRERILKMN